MADKNTMNVEWLGGGTTKDEGWKIKDAYIGNEDDGYDREWIATVYDEEVRDYTIACHNCNLIDRKTK